jgi:hypothetical protein
MLLMTDMYGPGLVTPVMLSTNWPARLAFVPTFYPRPSFGRGARCAGLTYHSGSGQPDVLDADRAARAAKIASLPTILKRLSG